jgi:glutamate synthase domain-containing protein 3
MAALTCEGRTVRDVNEELRRRLAAGESDLVVAQPSARHNLGVALLSPGKVTFQGSVGYYCAGLIDGASVVVEGSAGWGLAESMLTGNVVVNGNAGNSAAAAIRGGTVVIHGAAAARTGVSMKGGTVLVVGDCGYMSGFMGQKGTLIVCGDAGEAFADSMYETVCYVGGRADDLGGDAVFADLSNDDIELLESTLTQNLPASIRQSKPAAAQFKKVVAGRKLWNFDRGDWKTWQEAL